MTPVAANRLLNAPTTDWVAYQSKNPSWGAEIAQCLRAGTLSPLAATNNLRKLIDCMADPDIQPLLCDWFARSFVPNGNSSLDKFERVQEGLGKCVRSLQLQAIAQGQAVNILDKTQHLCSLSGSPLENNAVWHSWLLSEDDIYTTARKKNEYFSNGKSLGGKTRLKKTLSQYQKFVVETMATHATIAKDLKTHLPIEIMAVVASGNMPMAPALLWEHNRLDMPLKCALAHYWANDTSPWSTREQDRLLSPKDTQYWDALAVHAQTYLSVMSHPTFASNGSLDFHGALAILKTCPPMPTTNEKFDDLDNGVFNDACDVVN